MELITIRTDKRLRLDCEQQLCALASSGIHRLSTEWTPFTLWTASRFDDSHRKWFDFAGKARKQVVGSMGKIELSSITELKIIIITQDHCYTKRSVSERQELGKVKGCN